MQNRISSLFVYAISDIICKDLWLYLMKNNSKLINMKNCWRNMHGIFQLGHLIMK